VKTQSAAQTDNFGGKTPSALGFRGHISELDGLRAVAVILVLFAHFGPQCRAGSLLWKIESVGWTGVDLFFVLSGFLITGILLDSRESRSYYQRFYVRRSLRILPLYYFVLLASVLILLVWHVGSARHNLCEASWYLVYLGNARSAFTGHMPDVAPLGPLWSLQIEEQFYLIFPYLVRSVKPASLGRMLLGVVLLSGPLRWLLYWWNPHWVIVQYVASPCRLDGLALGGLIALRARMGPWRLRPAYVAWVAVGLSGALCVYLIWGGYDWSSGRIRTFGYSMVALAFASVLLWVLTYRGAWQTAWLRLRPLQYLGRISYGIYLLQVPSYLLVGRIFAHFGKRLVTGESWHAATWLGFGAVGVCTVALASLSWYVLERPFLRAKNRFIRSVEPIRGGDAGTT